MNKDMTVGVEQASDENSVAVQGLGDLSNGTYNEIIVKSVMKQLQKRGKPNSNQGNGLAKHKRDAQISYNQGQRKNALEFVNQEDH